MSREIFLSMDESQVLARCAKENIGVSVTERLPDGGTRLVCNNSDDAVAMRHKLKANVMTGTVRRAPLRQVRPQW